MDWAGRNKEAMIFGKYTEEDITLALSYATCAVGERIAQLRAKGIEPMVEWVGQEGEQVEAPVNMDVSWAAVMFYSCVSRSYKDSGPGRYTPRDAMRWYDKIQAWDGS